MVIFVFVFVLVMAMTGQAQATSSPKPQTHHHVWLSAGSGSGSGFGSDSVTTDSQSASSASSSSSDLDLDYVIIIDAGSSGSRIHVHTYYWSSSLPVISASKNKKVKPGLSAYAKQPQQAVSVVSDLLSFAKATVPMHKWKTTPFHLQATAGVRSLPADESYEILEVVRDGIQKSPFLFQRSWARVIAGSDEGINGWLATNYLSGVWNSQQHITQTQTHQQQVPATTGVVEMGGASIQVTYVPNHITEQEHELLYPMTIAGHEYLVYTYSYLSYGLQAAESLFQKRAIADIEQDGNPCYPTGLKHSATGSFERCLSLVSRHLFDKDATCPHTSCSFNGIYQPILSSSDKFLAIENFYYTTQFFTINSGLFSSSSPSAGAGDSADGHLVSVLRHKGSQYCGLPWTQIKQQHHTTSQQELSLYCFASAYEHSMLTNALGFSSTSNIQAIREIQGKPIDWELGAVLRELLRYQQMGPKYGSSVDSEYDLELPASEGQGQGQGQEKRATHQQKLVGVGDVGGGGSMFIGCMSGWWLCLSSWSSVSLLMVLCGGIAIAYRINTRNKHTRCLPDQALANLGYVQAKAAQHVV